MLSFSAVTFRNACAEEINLHIVKYLVRNSIDIESVSDNRLKMFRYYVYNWFGKLKLTCSFTPELDLQSSDFRLSFNWAQTTFMLGKCNWT